MEKIATQLQGRHRIAVLILGQAGPRPGELFGTGNSPGIKWNDLKVDDSGCMRMHVFAGKTGTNRMVRINPKLQSELEEWREQVNADPDDLIVPSTSGGRWSEWDYRNWRSRTWANACARSGVGVHRPYDLRHGFASVLLHNGHRLPEVANQLGHSVQICSSTYAHVIEGLAVESSSNVPW
jgi:integrase